MPVANKGFLIAVFYGAMSISAICFNKSLLSSWGFNFPITFIFFQCVFSTIMLYSLKVFGLVNFRDFKSNLLLQVGPLVIVFAANVLVGLIGLKKVNIPMFSTLRHTNAAFIVVAEYLFLNQVCSKQILLAVVVMIAGALIAGFNDLTFDLFGYLFVMFNNVTTTTYLILIKKLTKSAEISSLGLVFYNSLFSFPFLILGFLFSDEWERLPLYPYFRDMTFQLVFVFSCAQICLLNYSQYLCTSYNSPLTTCVTGQIKGLLLVVSGYIMFSDVKYDPYNIAGVIITSVGSVLYTHFKYLEMNEVVAPVLPK